MTDIPNNDVALGDAEVVSEDLPCTGCGYNLRGLSSEGRCPECGLPVERTTQNYLRYADPAWLDQLAKGTMIFFWSMIIILILSLVGNGFVNVFGLASIVVGEVVMMVALVLGLWGVWLLTSPEPGREAATPVTARNVIRVCALVASCSSIIATAMAISDPLGVGGGMQMLILTLVSVVARIAQIVQYLAMFVYFRRLARRLPDQKLESSTTTAMRGVITGLILSAVVWVVMISMMMVAFAPSAGGGAGPGESIAFAVFGIVVIGIGILFLILLIWTLILLHKYRIAFAQAADLSRQMLDSPSGEDPASTESDDSLVAE